VEIPKSEVDEAIEKMTHVALTALFERCLADTIDTPNMLLSIRGQEEPE
jgi:hypothetical protein